MLFFRVVAVPRIFEAVLHRGSAASRSGSAAPIQVIMASFRIAMASFGIGSIYTHLTPPGDAANALTILNPSQAI